MQGLTGPDSFLPDDEELASFQKEFEKAWKEKGLKDEDPVIQTFFKEFFKDETKVQTWVSDHDGKISAVISQLDRMGVPETKIKEFCNRVLTLKKDEAKSSSTQEKPAPSKPVPLEFMCDLDSPDHNSAMLSYLNSAFTHQSAVVTTQSLFRGMRIQKLNNAEWERDQLVKELDQHYDFYRKGAFLVFVPKKLGENLTARERLEKLDLDANELKKVSLAEAWEITDDPADIEGFQNLFVSNPSHDKQIHIAGHGGVGLPGGLTNDHYRSFLAWSEKQRCKGLLVSSCYAGGESTKLHLPQKKSGEPVKYEPEPPKGVSFPVFVRSIGEFPTWTKQRPDEDVPSFFSQITEILNSPGGQTVFRLTKLFKKEEKSPANLLQVYFPHTSDSPGGFRPMGEGGVSFSLTFVRFQKGKIEKGKIEVNEQAYLELFPTVVDVPLVFTGKHPVFLSMVPGRSLHLMKEVSLEGVTPQEFLKKQGDFYRSQDLGVKKVVMISSLREGSNEWSQVSMNLQTGNCLYREGDKYFQWNAQKTEKPKEISSFEFVYYWNKLTRGAFPSDDSLRIASGGQEDIQTLKAEVEQEAFWGKQLGDYNKYKELFSIEAIKKGSVTDYLEQISSLNLKKEEKATLISYILPYNEQLACDLLEMLALSPDSKDMKGCSLLIRAAQNNCVAFARLLFNKNVSLLARDPIEKNSALVYASDHKDGRLFALLLEQKPLFARAKNTRGNPAYAYYYDDLEKLKKLKERDSYISFNVSITNQRGDTKSLLNIVLNQPIETMEYLLQSGADPNGFGEGFSPLTQAVIQGEQEKITLLLKYGADPYKKDEKGKTPIVEAMKRGSPQLVQQLLKQKVPDLPDEEKKALSLALLIAAIETGEEKKIRLVLQQKDAYPDTMPFDEGDSFISWLRRLHLFGNTDIIREMAGKGIYKDSIITWAVEKAPELLFDFMDPNSNFPKILEKIIRNEEFPTDLRQKIVDRALELGADLNKRISPYGVTNLLQLAIRYQQWDLARLFISKGADPNKAALSILETQDMDFLKFAISNGLKIEPDTPDQPSLLLLLSQSDLSDKKNREMFTFLVDQGADLLAMVQGQSPFYNVVKKGDEELYSYCLKKGGDKILNNKQALSQLLVLASQNPLAGEGIVKDLVGKGADLNGASSDDFVSPFAAVVRFASPDLIAWCIDQGANVSPDNPSLEILPLQAATIRGADDSAKVVKLLLAKGADLNQRGKNNSLAIIPILREGNTDLTKFCFEQGAKLPDAPLVERAFVTATLSGKLPLIELLEQQGYSYSLSDWNEEDAAEFLKDSYRAGGEAVLEKVLSMNPPKGAIKKAGSLLLGRLIEEGGLKAFQLLKANGVSFDADEVIQEFDSYTLFPYNLKESNLIIEILQSLKKEDLKKYINDSLKQIINTKNVKLIEFSLNNGLDPNKKVIHIFEERALIFEIIDTGDKNLLRQLIDAGANLKVTCEDMEPSIYAQFVGNDELVPLLSKKKG